MAVGSDARRPQGLQIGYIRKRYNFGDLATASWTNNTGKVIGKLPKHCSIVATYVGVKTAFSGGARQLKIGTASAGTQLVSALTPNHIQEGTAGGYQVLKGGGQAFTQDTDIYATWSSLTTTRPTAGQLDIVIAYVPNDGDVTT